MANKVLPKMLATTLKALTRSHVESSTESLMSDINSRYGELKDEIKKDALDWILVGALVMAVVKMCDDAVRQSSRDIRNYEEGIERDRRRKRDAEDSARRRRNSNSSYGGYGGGNSMGGGFGGGMSGGAGSTGRF